MTTYELWQLNKYGNYIPEQETNDDEEYTNYTDGQSTEAVCYSERPELPTEPLERDNQVFQSL